MRERVKLYNSKTYQHFFFLFFTNCPIFKRMVESISAYFVHLLYLSYTECLLCDSILAFSCLCLNRISVFFFFTHTQMFNLDMISDERLKVSRIQKYKKQTQIIKLYIFIQKPENEYL